MSKKHKANKSSRQQAMRQLESAVNMKPTTEPASKESVASEPKFTLVSTNSYHHHAAPSEPLPFEDDYDEHLPHCNPISDMSDLPSEITNNSMNLGRAALAWLIAPMSVESFYANYYEQRPLFIRRNLINDHQWNCNQLIEFLTTPQTMMHYAKEQEKLDAKQQKKSSQEFQQQQQQQSNSSQSNNKKRKRDQSSSNSSKPAEQHSRLFLMKQSDFHQETSEYYSQLMSYQSIIESFKTHNIKYATDIDITQVTNDIRTSSGIDGGTLRRIVRNDMSSAAAS
jgi:hypothetical protein